MNEDICKREVPIFTDALAADVLGRFATIECNKPKNPEFLYCDDCMREAFDESLLNFRERQQSEKAEKQ